MLMYSSLEYINVKKLLNNVSKQCLNELISNVFTFYIQFSKFHWPKTWKLETYFRMILTIIILLNLYYLFKIEISFLKRKYLYQA